MVYFIPIFLENDLLDDKRYSQKYLFRQTILLKIILTGWE
jgi:hypothetical protein